MRSLISAVILGVCVLTSGAIAVPAVAAPHASELTSAIRSMTMGCRPNACDRDFGHGRDNDHDYGSVPDNDRDYGSVPDNDRDYGSVPDNDRDFGHGRDNVHAKNGHGGMGFNQKQTVVVVKNRDHKPCKCVLR